MENKTQNPIPEPTPPMVSPVELPKPKNNYILVIFLSVLLIFTILIAGLFYFQIQKLSKELSKYQTQPSPTPTATPDPTADWKTYTNKKYLFQLQYPPSYSETLNPEENDIWFDFPGPPYPPEIVININVNPLKPKDTLSGYVEESLNYIRTKLTEPNDFKITKTNEMQLGGERAIMLNYEKSGLEGETIYMIHANYRYSINRFSVNSAGGKLVRNEEFDQILSTFKFLD